jgi:hypothetical protein
VGAGEPEVLRRQAEARRGRVLEVSAPTAHDAAAAALDSQGLDLAVFGRKIHVFTHDPVEARRRVRDILTPISADGTDIQEVRMRMDDVLAALVGGEGDVPAAA